MNPIDALMETATPLQRKLLEGCKWVPETGCWEYERSLTGHMRFEGVGYNPRRTIYEEFVGPIFNRDRIKMTCRGARCVCPAHMKPYDYAAWSYDRCKRVFNSYDDLSDLSKNHPSAYATALNKGWLDDFSSHMIKNMGRVPHGHWDDETIRAEALKYKTRTEFMKKSSGAYAAALLRFDIDDICSHMVQNTPNGYWTDERLRGEALKFETRSAFQKGSSSAYSIAQRKGIIDSICAHMGEPRTNSIRYEKDEVLKSAKKYKTRSAFQKGDKGSYDAAKRHGWDEAFEHMVRTRLPPGHWQNKENCAEAAKNYNSRTDFARNADGAYKFALKNGFLDKICSHMVSDKMPAGHWDDKERCEGAAKLCKSRRDLYERNSPAYQAAIRNDWIDEFFPNFQKQKPHNYWNDKEKCRVEASKYPTRTLFGKGSSGAWRQSRKNGWLDEFFPKPT